MYFFIFFEDAVLKYFWFRFQAQNLKFRVWSENFSGDNGDGKLDENEYLLDMTDPSNPVLRIGDAELPVSKNILIKDGVSHGTVVSMKYPNG
ncbi:Alkaline phosphatase [Methanosarcina siciliae C2J]|uniref:Alkaline phosphatase n=4 Tax=Methanosarcina siciliae TaxID=38027 RepID=A0A0E3PI92_9EURY|nr:hypothetical protein [Methanosarcina siciliae]AKB30358.1 Alkaline phosphatase [Methanosarcina siciliae T4/M]AKB34269.1 Alkaline phosphatase [Methanosarcina siciliae HI350]AKB38641.1 Alkaline phosphatase [Methanosarcina siciliae C2J]